MSAATQAAPSTSSDSAPTRDCPEPTMNASESNFDANDARRAIQGKMGGPEGVVSFVASNLSEKSRELGYLCGQIYMLSDAVSYHAIEEQIDFHGEDEWFHHSTINPQGEAKREALAGIAEEVGAFGIDLKKKAKRLEAPETTLGEAARSVANELERLSDLLRLSENKTGTVRRSLMYSLARINLVKTKRRHAVNEGSCRVHGSDLRLVMESEPVVKQLEELVWELFEFAGWFEELSRRLRLAFPDDEE